MIWVGIFLAVVGGTIFYRNAGLRGIPLAHLAIAIALIVNGYFLSFKVSPFLLQRERSGRQAELLPVSWQRKIMVSLLVSDLGWWGGLALLVFYLISR